MTSEKPKDDKIDGCPCCFNDELSDDDWLEYPYGLTPEIELSLSTPHIPMTTLSTPQITIKRTEIQSSLSTPQIPVMRTEIQSTLSTPHIPKKKMVSGQSTLLIPHMTMKKPESGFSVPTPDNQMKLKNILN